MKKAAFALKSTLRANSINSPAIRDYHDDAEVYSEVDSDGISLELSKTLNKALKLGTGSGQYARAVSKSGRSILFSVENIDLDVESAYEGLPMGFVNVSIGYYDPQDPAHVKNATKASDIDYVSTRDPEFLASFDVDMIAKERDAYETDDGVSYVLIVPYLKEAGIDKLIDTALKSSKSKKFKTLKELLAWFKG